MTGLDLRFLKSDKKRDKPYVEMSINISVHHFNIITMPLKTKQKYMQINNARCVFEFTK